MRKRKRTPRAGVRPLSIRHAVGMAHAMLHLEILQCNKLRKPNAEELLIANAPLPTFRPGIQFASLTSGLAAPAATLLIPIV